MINTSVTGLNAAKIALNITSKNIANAGVKGYSRQTAQLSSSDVSGVYVSDIKRVSSGYANKQLWFNASQFGHSTTQFSHASQLENVVSRDASSLSPALNKFFSSLSKAGADPMDIAYRQTALTSSKNLAARFNSQSNALNKQFTDLDQQMASLVEEANTAITDISKINRSINEAKGTGAVPGQLLDERDLAVQRLTEIIGVNALISDDQTVNITLPGGELLVNIAETSKLTLVAGTPDSTQRVLAVDNGTSTKTIEKPSGGIGGLVDFRNNTLLPAKRDLDRAALALIDRVNDQMTKGFDNKGEKGKELFKGINNDNARLNRSSHFKGPRNVNLSVEIADTSKLTASNYTLTKNQDGKLVVLTQPGSKSVDVTKNSDGSISFDGLTIKPDAGKKFTDMAKGEGYLIEPGKNASGTMEVVMNDPERLAFSAKADERGNNENLQELVKLQDKPIIGNMSISQSWNRIVSNVASASSQAKNSHSANTMLYKDAQNKVSSVSGVNLDEEAANMLMYQQLYSANTKVISAADEMFRTLLSVV